MKTTLLMVCGHQRLGRFSLRRHRRNRQGREGMFLVSCARTSKSDVRRLPCFLQGMDAEADIRVGEGSFGATLWSRLAENTFTSSLVVCSVQAIPQIFLWLSSQVRTISAKCWPSPLMLGDTRRDPIRGKLEETAWVLDHYLDALPPTCRPPGSKAFKLTHIRSTHR